jgi:U3 small nucleolar RNA-associated protein 16
LQAVNKKAIDSDASVPEGTVTLQDANSKDVRLPPPRTLPALLPEEILNAEPTVRPPTPTPDNDRPPANTSNKRKLLAKVGRHPKDIKVDGTTIRVLELSGREFSGSGTYSEMTPKASKAGRFVRESWMAGNRSGGSGSSLRRTAGGPSGFIRR